MIRQLSIFAMLVVAFFSIAACSDSGGGSSTGMSVTISAPNPMSPANGAQVTGQVTLTVSNVQVTGGSGVPTYTFQIASDNAFGAIIAQASNIPQGSGQTSWTAGSEIASGQFFWRARASVGTTTGAFSSVGNFSFQGGASTAGSTDQVLLFDPLTGGSSMGDVGGGEFTPEGWKVIASSNFIVYDMETIESGFLSSTSPVSTSATRRATPAICSTCGTPASAAT